MARKHQASVPESEGALILPLELLRSGLGADQSAAEWYAERRQWFRARGVDPADERRILIASDRFHGIPNNSLDRAWVRAVGIEAWRQIHQGGSEGSARSGAGRP